LNWKDEKREKRTISLVVKMRKINQKMEFDMKLIEEEIIMRTNESEFTIKTAVGIGCFLTQKII
jgi:hypothetical protein